MKLLGRSLALSIGLCSLAAAQPRLTTIQDTIYKADGTRLNGSVTITWNSFQTSDATVGMQTVTVPIVNGSLWVQLAPTIGLIPVVTYAAHYQSDGQQQFFETWSVPFSQQPVRLRDVRIDTNSTLTGTVPAGQSPILETDVVGLVADLGLRPVKGPDYSTGRAAVINASGQLDGVLGSPSDCVHVDGTSGACSAGSSFNFVDNESPAGVVDGANNAFTVAALPVTASLKVFRNGLLMKPGVDYSLSSMSIQFLVGATPQPGDTLLASYRTTAAVAAPLIRFAALSAPVITAGPEIVCGATGNSTNLSTLASLGSCAVPAGLLNAGDRVEIRYSYAHRGSAKSFGFVVKWGASVVAQGTASAADSAFTGRADAAIDAAGALLSNESWGSVSALKTSASNATDSLSQPLLIDFQAQSGGDPVVLRNYLVVRYPAVPQ